MGGDLAEGILLELRQPDRRPVSEWAADGNVVLPHSKRCRDYREDTAYWLSEPLNSIVHNEATSVCKCTQGGGTTLYEVFAAWLIANAPADCSLMAQTDPDAQRLFEEKLLPTLKASPATMAAIAAAGRNDITKDKLKLGSMVLRIHGCGKNSMQSASLEVILGDECWLFPLGTILEILERTSTREATRKIVMVSQAGEEQEDAKGNPVWDEWGQWWHRGTQEIYNVRCPACSQYFEIETKHVSCAESARDSETKVWDWQAVRSTAVLTTPCCQHRIENTEAARRSLSASGKYIATNPNPSPRHRSFRFSAWVVYWQDWGGLLEMFLRAQEALHQGNIEPLKIFTQKKEARWWTLKAREIPVINTKAASGYRIETYEPKEGEEIPRIESEEFRFAGIDMQRDRFPIVIRAFGGGRSRVLTYEEPQKIEDVNELTKQYAIPSRLVGLDVGNWSKDAMRFCWQYKWTALRGRDINNFTKTRGKRVPVRTRYQAVPERLTGDKIYGAGVTLKVWEWSNTYFKDIFSRLRVMPEHEFPDDISPIYIEGMESEAKHPKTGIWKQIGSRANHPWDCEAMITFMAFLYKLVGSQEESKEAEESEH